MKTDRIKVGYHEDEDGTFTAFAQFKKLPDEGAARNACEGLADLLLQASRPKSTIIQ